MGPPDVSDVGIFRNVSVVPAVTISAGTIANVQTLLPGKYPTVFKAVASDIDSSKHDNQHRLHIDQRPLPLNVPNHRKGAGLLLEQGFVQD